MKNRIFALTLLLVLGSLAAMEAPEREQQYVQPEYYIILSNETDEKLTINIQYTEGMLLKNLTNPTIVAPYGIFTAAVLPTMNWPVVFNIKSSRGIPLIIRNTVTGIENEGLILLKDDADTFLAPGYGPPKQKSIRIILRKQKDSDHLNAFTRSGDLKFLIKEKKEEQKKRVLEEHTHLLTTLESTLEIEPNSIQKSILDLGLAKNFDAIQTTVQNTNDLENLKKIITLQINLALFIINRMTTDMDLQLGFVFTQPEQNLLSYKSGSCREDQAQCSYMLLSSRQQVQQAQSLDELRNPMQDLHKLLLEIGYSPIKSPLAFLIESPFSILKIQLKCIDDFKTALIENFKLLFEHLAVVKTIKPSPVLEEMKKKMKL